MITVIAGGVGAARFLTGLVQVRPPERDHRRSSTWATTSSCTACTISPDLDTITYTLAGAIDPERGWGLAGETWQAMETLGRYGGATWFNLGDRDLGTHLYRTAPPAARARPLSRGDRRDRRRRGGSSSACSRSPTTGSAPC